MPVDPWAIDSLAFTGLEARNAEAFQVMTDGTALGSRSGVRPGDPGLTVTLAGSTINCSAGVAAVAYAGQGVYKCAFPSSVSPGSLTAAHATLDRIDLVGSSSLLAHRVISSVSPVNRSPALAKRARSFFRASWTVL